MHESLRKAPPAARWLRIAALAAVLALGLHGAGTFGHDHDPGGDQDCAFCHATHVQALAPESPAPPHALPAIERPASEPAAVAASSFRRLPPLRGPPAA